MIQGWQYWFSSLTTVTPITHNHCRIVVACWNIFNWVPFGPSLLKFVFAKFVEQDRHTMELQAEGLKYHPHLMLIMTPMSSQMVLRAESGISKPSGMAER